MAVTAWRVALAAVVVAGVGVGAAMHDPATQPMQCVVDDADGGAACGMASETRAPTPERLSLSQQEASAKAGDIVPHGVVSPLGSPTPSGVVRDVPALALAMWFGQVDGLLWREMDDGWKGVWAAQRACLAAAAVALAIPLPRCSDAAVSAAALAHATMVAPANPAADVHEWLLVCQAVASDLSPPPPPATADHALWRTSCMVPQPMTSAQSSPRADAGTHRDEGGGEGERQGQGSVSGMQAPADDGGQGGAGGVAASVQHGMQDVEVMDVVPTSGPEYASVVDQLASMANPHHLDGHTLHRRLPYAVNGMMVEVAQPEGYTYPGWGGSLFDGEAEGEEDMVCAGLAALNVDTHHDAVVLGLDVYQIGLARCRRQRVVARLQAGDDVCAMYAGRVGHAHPACHFNLTWLATVAPPPSAHAVTAARQESVRRAALHAWMAYEAYAWGRDILRPHSRVGVEDLSKMGMTLVDGLDTLLIMGAWDEAARAAEWLATNMTVGWQADINLFETTIRVVGGLLSAHALTHDRRMAVAAERVMAALIATGAFQTPTTIPWGTVTMTSAPRPSGAEGGGGLEAHGTRTEGHLPGTGVVGPAGWAYNPNWISGSSSVSEVATLQVELVALARATGVPAYATLATSIMRHVSRTAPPDALFPIYVDPRSGFFKDAVVTLGARGDSLYEYLVKQWIQAGGWAVPRDRIHALAPWAVQVVLHRRAAAVMVPLVHWAQPFMAAARDGMGPAGDGHAPPPRDTMCATLSFLVHTALPVMARQHPRPTDGGGGDQRDGEGSGHVLRAAWALGLLDAIQDWPAMAPHAFAHAACRQVEPPHLHSTPALQRAAAAVQAAFPTIRTPSTGAAPELGAMPPPRDHDASPPLPRGLPDELGAWDTADATYLLQLYNAAVCNVRDSLVTTSTPSGWVYVAAQDHSTVSPQDSKPTLIHEMDHLTCFLPGTLALGAAHGAGHPALYQAALDELVATASRDAVATALAADPTLHAQVQTWRTLSCVWAGMVQQGGNGTAMDPPPPNQADLAATFRGFVAACRALEFDDDAALQQEVADELRRQWHVLQQMSAIPGAQLQRLVDQLPATPSIAYPRSVRSPHPLLMLLASGGPLPGGAGMGGGSSSAGGRWRVRDAPGAPCASGEVNAHLARRQLMQLAAALMDTCIAMYDATTTGLAPEIVTFRPGADFKPNHDARHSLLRPETVESLFVLHRLTGNATYQEAGWRMFHAMEAHARVAGGGYASVKDVDMPPASDARASAGKWNQHDKMESFALAETFKYLYLLFSDPPAHAGTSEDGGGDHHHDDPSVLNLRRWVYNTEAHPVLINHTSP